MRSIFVSYTASNNTGNAVFEVEDNFIISGIKDIRTLAKITKEIEPALSYEEIPIITNWKWLPDIPKETSEQFAERLENLNPKDHEIKV